MGCGGSTPVEDGADAGARQRTAEIDAQLKRDRQQDKSRIKILLLGAGESGKSTVLKQMRLMYQGTYSERERIEYKEVIWSNMIQSMQAVLDAAQALGIQLEDSRTNARAQLLLGFSNTFDETENLPPQLADAVQGLWMDPTIKKVVARQNEFQLNDSAQYYFDSVGRLAAPNYMPSDQDILRSRVKTTGITETQFQVDKFTFCLYDVGGQRSERKKWIHCFENVNVLLFLVAISEYDQMLYEDESVSRMSESLTLFESISNSRWFEKSCLCLFLNKVDLFAQKLPVSPLGKYLPEYTGKDNDFQAACQFMHELFGRLYQTKGHRSLYTHFTCATDTKTLQVVLQAVQDTILRQRFSEGVLAVTRTG